MIFIQKGDKVRVANPFDNDNLDEMVVIDVDKTSNTDIILERKTSEWIDSCRCSSDDIKLEKTGKYICYTIGWFSRDEVD